MSNKQFPRMALSAAIVLYFGYSLGFHYDAGFEEMVKNTFMIVVGYWLGSSNGSFNKDERTRTS